MTDTEAELLRLIAAETDRVERLSPYRDINADVSEWVARSSATKDLKAGLGVRIGTEWIGSDAACRQARGRALRTLERFGLVELYSVGSSRLSHVRIVGRKLPPPPPSPPVVAPAAHVPTTAEMRHARLVAWSAECRAKETAEVSQLFAESDAWVDRTLSELAEGETLSSLREQLQADGSEPRE